MREPSNGKSMPPDNGMVRRLPKAVVAGYVQVKEDRLLTAHVCGIDIGKTVFHLIGLSEQGQIVLKKRLNRKQLITLTVNMPACLMGMEACAGSHLLARVLRAQGHDVKLMPAEYVRPFVKSNKNDYVDAEAIAEAVQRPTMRFVPIKNEAQLDLQALHRVRDRWMGRRTAVINQIRGFLLEHGIAVSVGAAHLQRQIPSILEDAENILSPRMRSLVLELRGEWEKLEEQIDEVTQELAGAAREDENSRRLLTVPGIGPLTATALTAAVGNGMAFRKGRDLAAWLGLVPRQHSTGGKSRLLGISKRGNPYLRRLFVHGARSVLARVKRSQHRFGGWLDRLEARSPRNVAIVALANKLARIAWAVLTSGQEYCATVGS
jgi:transposase